MSSLCAIASLGSYTLSSMVMILLHKLVIAKCGLNFPSVVVLCQNVLALVVLFVLRLLGMVSWPRLTYALLLRWGPLTIMFVIMLTSSIHSLRTMSVSMSSVLKSVALIFIAVGEARLFNQHLNCYMVAGFLFIITGASVGSVLDPYVTTEGLFWVATNVFATVGYMLYLKYLMSYPIDTEFINHLFESELNADSGPSHLDSVHHAHSHSDTDPHAGLHRRGWSKLLKAPSPVPSLEDKEKDDDSPVSLSGIMGIYGPIFYNNLLSIPLLLCIALPHVSDFARVFAEAPQSSRYAFFAQVIMGPIVTFCVFWCMSLNTATSYSVMGALNKVPVSFIAAWYFDQPVSLRAWFSVLVAFFGGLLYAIGKSIPVPAPNKKEGESSV